MANKDSLDAFIISELLKPRRRDYMQKCGHFDIYVGIMMKPNFG